MKSQRPTIAIFFGGNTENFDLSQETGQWLCSYIPRSQYRVIPVRVTPEGTWQVPLGGLPQQGPIERMMHVLFSSLRPLPATQALQRLLQHPIAAMMTTIRGLGGDDGSLQSLGSALKIPVAGSSAATCQQTSHKHLCAAQLDDIVSSPYGILYPASASPAEIAAQVREVVRPPFFVKPANQEGSAGVVLVDDFDMLPAALEAHGLRGETLIQEQAPGEEVTISLVEDEQGRVSALPATQIVPTKARFYDSLAKRRAGRVKLHTPEYSAALFEAEEIAQAAYAKMGCRGYASFDMVVGDRGVHLLEVNTVPTLTEMTPLKTQLAAAHYHPAQMIDSLLRTTLHSPVFS